MVQQVQVSDLGKPVVAVIGGNPGLAPARVRDEVAEPSRRVLHAETAAVVQQRRTSFVRKWRLQCQSVVQTLEEAGDELFTLLRFLRPQWRALRTTNALERINEEFRRRTKTQASLPSQDAVLLLIFGRLRAGQTRVRRIGGSYDVLQVTTAAAAA